MPIDQQKQDHTQHATAAHYRPEAALQITGATPVRRVTVSAYRNTGITALRQLPPTVIIGNDGGMFTVGAMEGLGSELLADLCTHCHGERHLPVQGSDPVDPHAATEPCKTCGGTGRRVPRTIDIVPQ